MTLSTGAIAFFPIEKKSPDSKKKHEAQAVYVSSIVLCSDRHLNIFTDASLDYNDQSAACAIYIPYMDVQKSWSIRNVSIASAELLAIENALLQVYFMTNLDSFTIYSDSKTAIECIQSFKEENDVAIRINGLINCCKLAGITPSIKWIRGHAGIAGNVTADKLATSGRTNPTEGPLDH